MALEAAGGGSWEYIVMQIQSRPMRAVVPARVQRATAPAPAPRPASVPARPLPQPTAHKGLGTLLGGAGGALAGAAAGFGTLVLLSAEGATGLNIGIALGVAGAVTAGGAFLGRWLGKHF